MYDLAAKTQAVRPILAIYRRYLEQPPVAWTFMPLTAELSPAFAARYPEIANIFDSLHVLHDNISGLRCWERWGSPSASDARRMTIWRIFSSSC
ncbi:MAG: hypothetical protein ABIR36_04505 [Nitrospiraceae bacterium]